MSTAPRGNKVRTQGFYVQVVEPDGTPLWNNAARYLGRPHPFTKPLATTMIRVRDDAILFSTLLMHKRVAAKFAQEKLAFTPGPLARLERRIDVLPEDFGTDKIIVEYGEDRHVYDLSRNEYNVATLDYAGEGEEPVIEVPRKPIQVTLYLVSPTRNLPVIVGWQGYQARPGTNDTLLRVAASAIKHLLSIPAFSNLTGIASVTVPAQFAGRALSAVRRNSNDVAFDVPTILYARNEENTPIEIGKGNVTVKLDVEASGTLDRLVFVATPPEELTEMFEPYQHQLLRAVESVFDSVLDEQVLRGLPSKFFLDEELDVIDTEQLTEAAGKVGGYFLLPEQFERIPDAALATD